MAIKALDLSALHRHVPDSDPDKGTEAETRFELGVLDSKLLGKLKDDVTTFAVNPAAPDDEVDVSVNQNQLHYLVCRHGIKGWSNLKDVKGDDVPYITRKKNVVGNNYLVVDEAVLSAIPSDVLSELGAKIISLTEVSEEERKN